MFRFISPMLSRDFSRDFAVCLFITNINNNTRPFCECVHHHSVLLMMKKIELAYIITNCFYSIFRLNLGFLSFFPLFFFLNFFIWHLNFNHQKITVNSEEFDVKRNFWMSQTWEKSCFFKENFYSQKNDSHIWVNM